ncbi:hypothetical protein ACO0LD_16795 [Undibacterium sp. Ji83W]|uniref:hypothetical protein n=1 Tax=Undibacterium sp. Ji83W TaxID=3413043 RepID=UPI003BF09F1A
MKINDSNSQRIGLSKMTGQTFFIGTRKANGQISSISRGIDPMEFIELFKEKGEVKVLVDYSPLIEQLHDLHKSYNEKETRDEYNSMFNYWQEAKTYEDKQYRMYCSSVLTTKASDLINKLQQKLQKSQSDGDLTWKLNPYQMHGTHQMVDAFKIDAEMYMDALLIYIHSKASVEINSFKKDTVLSAYGEFLQKLIHEMYVSIVGKGGNNHSESFLKYLAFESASDFQQHMALSGGGESRSDFILRIVQEKKPCELNNCEKGYPMEVAIHYDNFWPNLMLIIEMLKELLCKIQSINDLLKLLRAGGVEWDADGTSGDDLKALLKLNQ